MQFAYQFPERTERLVLVSSGGLGREVHIVLRAASLPGADFVLPALTSRRLVDLGRGIGGLLGRVGLQPGGDIGVLARGFASLDNAGSRQAFLHTVRSVIEPGGQRVSASERLALAARIPTLIVWGEEDSIIPAAHGAAAHEAMPGSRFETFPGAGHMPHDDDPIRFAALLSEFCETTEGAQLTTTTGSRCWVTAGERRATLRPRRLVPRGRARRRADARRLGRDVRRAAAGFRGGARPPGRAARGRPALSPEARAGPARTARAGVGGRLPASIRRRTYGAPRAATSTRSSTGSSPRRCAATARCGRSGSPTSCRTPASR